MPSDNQSEENKIYPMSRTVIIMGVLLLLISCGFAGGLKGLLDDQQQYSLSHHTEFWDTATISVTGFVGLISLAAGLYALHSFRILFSKIVINNQGIERSETLEKSVFISWNEIGGLSERRKMQQMVVVNEGGNKRLLLDYQFNNFMEIQKRVFEEYQKRFKLPDFPIHLGKALNNNGENLIYPATVTRSAISLRGKIEADIPISEIDKVGFEYVDGFDKYGNPSSQWSYVSLNLKDGKSYTLGRYLGSVPEIYVLLNKVIETQ